MDLPRIADIWISAEHWAPGAWTPEDDLVDIQVTLSDGSRWIATVCAFAHVQTLRSRWARSGECQGGSYLWASQLILAVDTARPTIEAMLRDLLANREFTGALARIESDDLPPP